ncbi:hypothetical protein [Streptomyces sp. NPDC017991]|uniref:hypothetical protein n=1 Tax=Streptomyces sp. NPDC017991 TaxID=3365026 RepID=UPI003788E2AE
MNRVIHLFGAILVALWTFVVRRADHCILALEMAYLSLRRRLTNRNSVHAVPTAPAWPTGKQC